MRMENRNAENVSSCIKFLKRAKCDFTVYNSNYTTVIEHGETKRKFTSKKIGLSTFALYNVIKKEIKDFDFIERIKDDKIMMNQNVYFENREYLNDEFLPEVLNIDLKNAYPTTLRNSGAITNRTFNRLNGLDKGAKLASLGMLASTKDIMRYERGKPADFEIQVSEFAPAFYYCVKNVDFLMIEARRILGDYFIYFWVDGVYMRRETPLYLIDEVTQLFMEFGFEFHFEIVHDFKMYRRGNNMEFELTRHQYKKGGELIKKKKRFSVPDKTVIENINKVIKSLHNRK